MIEVLLLIEIINQDNKEVFDKHLKKEGFNSVPNEPYVYTGESSTTTFATKAYILQVVEKGLLKTNLGFDIGFGAEYDLLPLKYDLATVNNTVTGFDTVSIEQDETTTRYSVRFILGHKTDMGRPMIGMTQETLSIESDGDTSEETINYLVVGFDNRF